MKKRVLAVLLCLLLIVQVGCKKESEETIEEPKQSAALEEKTGETKEAEVEDLSSKEVSELNNKFININKEQMDKNEALFKDFTETEKEAKWTFPTIDSIGDWGEIPAPPISPLGEKSVYTEIEYEEVSDYTFEYIDDNQTVREREVFGERWEMYIPENDTYTDEENQQMIHDYEQFVIANGGIAFDEYRQQGAFYYEDQGNHYWVEIMYSSHRLYMTVMKERRFHMNETVIVKPAEVEDTEITYSVVIPDNQFVSLRSSIDSGRAYIDLEMATAYGDYERRTSIETSLNDEEGLVYVDDDYINEPGVAYVTVSWNKSSAPEVIEVMFEAKYEVQPIAYGEQLGGITLSADYVSKVVISPTIGENLRIEHPEYDEDTSYFDKNQEEEFVTFVPAGYYELEITMKDGIVDRFKTLKVPVHSGKMTEVVVPRSLTDAIKNHSAAEEEGIFISEVIENGDQVSFVFSLIDSKTREVSPDVLNSTIYEGGAACKIVAIEPIPTPPSIVVLLDSSGSMKGQMDQTIESAKAFIDGLPNNTDLTLIDFDSEPKLLEGASISELRAGLDSVKAKGATALYDSVIMGLNLLEGEERPTLVVFTDGEDANLNDTARGSKATYEEALTAINQSDVPLYTIGFGQGHDSATLEVFAQESLGKYYSAEDQSALVKVFDSINEKLGNTYLATYERPVASSISDIPVVSFVIDVSGSMYSGWDMPTTGYRLDDVKMIYHDFLQGLPPETQTMITSFNDDITIQQGITTDRVLALNAIGNLEAGGGTDIFGSVKYGYESLKKVASSKKIMIYLTDAALEVEEEDEERFNESLKELKNDNIQTLWVGMGVTDQTPFEAAAQASGGDYVISEDAKVLADKFEIMLNEVKQTVQSDKTAIALNIKKKTEEGAYEAYGSSILYELPPVKRSDEVVVLDTITYTVSDLDIVNQYDRVTSQYISGDTIPAEETVITKRIPVDVTNENDAMQMHANELIFMKRLAGVDAPDGQRFMGVLMDLSHVFPEQEVVVYPDGSGHPSSWVKGNNKGETKLAKVPYAIPNFSTHFGMSFNSEGPFPAATATWLAFEPLVVPGVYDMTLQPDTSQKGMMVFIVPDEPLDQLGLHYFDDKYGHIDMPVVGVMPNMATTFSANTGSASKLMDNFSIEISGYDTTEALDEPIEDSQHRLVDGSFISDVKAVIDLKPSEALYMRFASENGDFYSPLSTTTSSTPFGFYNQMAIAPGANSPIKMLFQMPTSLETNQSELFFDLRDEDAVIPVSSGSKVTSTVVESFETDYFTADVNNVFKFKRSMFGLNWPWILADVTIHDIEDGYATRGASQNFYVDFEGGPSEVVEATGLSGFASSNTYGYGGESRRLHRLGTAEGISEETAQLLFGMDEESIVYDGTSRRGFILFSVSSSDLDQPWSLSFDDTDLNIPVENGMNESYAPLLVEKEEADIDNGYQEELAMAVEKAIAEYKLRYPQVARTKIAGAEEVYDDVTMPSANAYGYQLASQIETVSDLETTIRSLRFINPGGATEFDYMFSKEAMLTQGFGTEGDFANLAIKMLSRLGYKTKRILVTTTDKGKEILEEMSGVAAHQIHWLPAVSYVNEQGQKKIMVLPFGRDLKDLEGLVYYEGTAGDELDSDRANLEIFYDVLPTEEGHLAQLNSMAGALGGGSSEVSISREYVDNFRIDLPDFSKDAVDIGTAVVGNKAYPIIYTSEGSIISEDYIDLNYYGIRGMGITIDGKDHYVQITEDMEVNQVFMTLAYNLPEIPEEAAEMISQQMASSQDLKADTLSSLKWLHRKTLYSFIANHTTFERNMEEGAEIITGRISNPRSIVVQSVIGDELTMSVDLLSIQNDLHSGEDEAHNSYRLMSGLAASQLEAQVLDNGLGFQEIWARMPEEANLVLFNTRDMDVHREDMFAIGMSEEMVAYFEAMSTMILVQSEPSMIDGKPRWAWLEIDEHDYTTISVIDTFEHGSMASNATLNSALEKAQYVVGAFKGVETSVWAMAAFSLELPDYEMIKMSALAFALEIGNNFEARVGPIELSGGKVPDLTGPAKDIMDFFKKGDGKEDDSTGFKEGYKKGVEFYFKIAQ